MVRVYDPKKVKVLVNGRMLTGLAEGGMIEVEKNEDNIVPYVGAQGDQNITLHADESETATVSLSSMSPSIHELRRLAENNSKFTFEMVDMNSDTIISCNDSFIVKTPTYSRSNEIEDVDVEIYLAHQPR